MDSNVIGSYNNGNYNVILLKDGTKIRCNNADELIPSGFESCDMKITNKCNNNCAYCHEDSKPDGNQCDPSKWTTLLDSMHPFTEVALGGGNPFADPAMLRTVLEMLKERDLVASVTLHFNDFVNNCDDINELVCDELLYGVGVSMPEKEWHYYLLGLLEKTPNVVLHCIYGITQPEAIRSGIGRDLRLLLLGYKTFRRGATYSAEHEEEIFDTMGKTDSLIVELLNDGAHGYKSISFDNLAVRQTQIRNLVRKTDWARLYMGDDGRTSVYIDLVAGEFSISSANHIRYKLLPEYTAKDVYEIANGLKPGRITTIDAGWSCGAAKAQQEEKDSHE